MGQQNYLMDTNVVIDFFNALLPSNAKKLILSFDPAISVITNIELFSSNNITEKERFNLELFVKTAKIYETINTEIVKQTINIRKLYKTKTPDAIIAATALHYDLILLTNNSSDFNKIKDLKIVNPYDL